MDDSAVSQNEKQYKNLQNLVAFKLWPPCCSWML